MKKKNSRRRFVGKIKQTTEIWISEEEMREELNLAQKLHPERTIEESIQELIDDGFVRTRFVNGHREFSLDKAVLNKALNKLPPESRSNYEVRIYEDIAILCNHDNQATMLLSVIIHQTDRLREHENIIPWIIKTHDHLTHDVMGIVKDIPATMNMLEAHGFIEITENGPTTYRYRLNAAVVQAAINALPERSEGGR